MGKMLHISSSIQSKCVKILTRITPNTNTFYTVMFVNLGLSMTDGQVHSEPYNKKKRKFLLLLLLLLSLLLLLLLLTILI